MARDRVMGEWRNTNNKIEDAKVTLQVNFVTGDYCEICDVTDFGVHPDGESYYFVRHGYENYIPRKNVVYFGDMCSSISLPKLEGVK